MEILLLLAEGSSSQLLTECIRVQFDAGVPTGDAIFAHLGEVIDTSAGVDHGGWPLSERALLTLDAKRVVAARLLQRAVLQNLGGH